jgi:3-oxoacyl-[acyl-carrier-protein] synthase II
MPACHIGIAQDARGPNNTITLGDVSSLSALAEAMRVLERGQADLIIAGGVGSNLHPTIVARMCVMGMSRHSDVPAEACRPFDASRDGFVVGEGAGSLIVETRHCAESRGASVLARLLGFSSAFEPTRNGELLKGTAIRRAIAGALTTAGLAPKDIGFVVAHGLGTQTDDQIEAQAIRETLGDVPVTALKGYFGHLAAAAGVLEAIAGVLAFQHGFVPPTLNYERPDPLCPVRVIHGEPMPLERPTAMILSHTGQGQAVAVVLGGAP